MSGPLSGQSPRVDAVRRTMARLTGWAATSVVFARAGIKRDTVILRDLESVGYLESRRDPAGSHELEWRRVTT